MRIQHLLFTGLMALLCFQSPLLAWANEPPKSGGQPIFMIDGAWNPAVGAWSNYKIVDHANNQISYMHFATMELEQIKGSPGRWMEIFVETTDEQNNPVEVATRVLAIEGDNGPEDVVTVIVQPGGYPPFTVPESMLDAKDSAQSDMKHVTVDPDFIKERQYTINGRSIKAYEVQGQDADGQRITAVVSGQVSPLGLVEADAGKLSMQLLDFGDNAQTRINGTPMNFYLWIAKIVGEGISEAMQ